MVVYLLRVSKTKSELFWSDMMMALFAQHLKTILKWPHEDHGKPLGALALCAAAVSSVIFLHVLVNFFSE
jgi:hypothetical protein